MGKSKKNNNPIIVYWAPEAIIEKEHQQVLLEMQPEPILRDIQTRRFKNNIPKGPTPQDPFGNGYQMCTALHELADNIYYIKAPFDVNIKFNNDGSLQDGPYRGWFKERISSIEGGKSADFDYSYMLFCEEKLEVSITPPFLHQTSQPEYGFICSVKWDISSWFRPHILIYQLWPNKNNIYFKANEPLAYLIFNTDRPIIFKEYKITQEILNISNACLNHKFIVPFQPMKRLYERFTKTSLKSRLAEAIKENIIN